MSYSFIKETFKRYPYLRSFVSWLFLHIGGNKIHYGNFFSHSRNIIDCKNGLLQHCNICYIGKGNIIYCGNQCHLKNCKIHIYGNNNRIIFNDFVHVYHGDFWIEDNNNCIEIGENSLICGPSHLAAIEGTNIKLGKECLISSETFFRTGDSHSVLDLNNKRINISKDIVIKDHVWICFRSGCTKGAEIGSNSILATGAICTKNFTEENIVLAGIPAKKVKEHITWNRKRI